MVRLMASSGRAVPWAAGVALAAPVLVTTYPPMSDLPMYEGIAALLRHYGDPAWAPPGLYLLNLGHPQQLVSVAIAAVSFVLPSALATKLVVAAIIIGMIAGMAHLLRYAGRSPWAALLLAPVTLGWAFFRGFAPYQMGMALLLWTVPVLDRFAERPTARGTGAVLGVVVLLFAAHVVAGACAVIVLTTLAVLRPLRWRTMLVAVPVAVFGGLVAVERIREAAVVTRLSRDFAARTLWDPLPTKVMSLVADLVAPHPIGTRALLMALPFLAVALFAVPRSTGNGPLSLRGSLIEHRFAFVAAALLCAYFALPYSINYGALLYVRFLGPAFAFLLVSLAPRGDSGRPMAKATCLVTIVATLAAVAPQFADASAQHRALATLYPRIQPGSAAVLMHLGARDREQMFDPASPAHRVLAERGGRLVRSFTEFPSSPVIVAADKRWDESAVRLQVAGAFQPSHDMQRMRYALVHLWDARLAGVVTAAFAPEGRVIGSAGEWLLLESTVPTMPPTAPESSPSPSAQTLQQRVDLLRRI